MADLFATTDSIWNSTSNATTSQILGLPSWLAWTQYVLFYMIIAGVLGLVTNTAVIVCVVRYKKFQTRFYIIVSFLSLTRTLSSIQYMILSVFRIWTLLYPSSVYQYRATCVCLNLAVYYSITDILLYIFMVADRVMAVLQPSYYRLLPNKQAILAGTVVLIVSFFLHVFPLFFGVDLTQVVTCANFLSGASVSFSNFVNYEPMALTILLLMMMSLALATTWRRLDKARKNVLDNEKNAYLRQQSDFMRAMRNMIFGHTFLTMLSRIFLTCFGIYPTKIAYFGAVVGILQSVDVFVSPIILFFSRKDLGEICLPIFSGKAANDASLNVTSKTHTIGPMPDVSDID